VKNKCKYGILSLALSPSFPLSPFLFPLLPFLPSLFVSSLSRESPPPDQARESCKCCDKCDTHQWIWWSLDTTGPGAFLVQNHAPRNSTFTRIVIQNGAATICMIFLRKATVWFQTDKGSAGIAYRPILYCPTSSRGQISQIH